VAEINTTRLMDVAVGALSYYELRLHIDKKIKRRIMFLGMIIIINGY